MKQVFLSCCLAAAVLTACSRGGGQEFSPAEPAIYITSEGRITSADMETYESDYYTAEELSAFVAEAIEPFDGAVAVQSCTLENGEARLLLDFDSASVYLDFLDRYPDEESSVRIRRLDIVPVPEAVTKGYLVGEAFQKPGSDGKTVGSDEVTKQSRLYAAMIEGPALIQTDGAIQYVSEGVTMDGSLARTPETGVSYIIFR